MPQQQQQQPDSSWIDPASGFAVATFTAQIGAACFTPVLHSRFGSAGLGVPGLIAFFLIFIWGAETHSSLMLRYWLLWVFMAVFRRLESRWIRWRGARIHSCYQGNPPLYRWLGEKARLLEILLLYLGWRYFPDRVFGTFLLCVRCRCCT